MHPALRLLAIGGMMAFSLMASQSAINARQVFPANGGSGDASAKDDCRDGSRTSEEKWHIVGFHGQVGAWIDAVGIICGRFGPDGSLAQERKLPRRGGRGGGEIEVSCPRGSVITEILPRMTEGWRQVIGITAQCTALAGGARSSIVFTNPSILVKPNAGMTGADPVPAQSPQTCPAGEAGTAMQINFGNHVNAVGMTCDDLFRTGAPAPVATNAGSARPPTQNSQPTGPQENQDRPGGDYQQVAMGAASECAAACGRNTLCRAWTWVKAGVQGPTAQCYLKKEVPKAIASNCCTSGVKAP